MVGGIEYKTGRSRVQDGVGGVEYRMGEESTEWG